MTFSKILIMKIDNIYFYILIIILFLFETFIIDFNKTADTMLYYVLSNNDFCMAIHAKVKQKEIQI